MPFPAAVILLFIVLKVSSIDATNLTGQWVAEQRIVAIIQTESHVRTTAVWGTGDGTIEGNTLFITFSNSDHKYVGAVTNNSCIEWDTQAIWSRVGTTTCHRHPSNPGPAVRAPKWADNLVIYEISPKAFTSPDGAGSHGDGSGTLVTAAEKLPALASMGITGIWLAGWAWSNAHFHGVWTTYAAMDLGTIDASLGGPTALKNFVDVAHAHGMRVLLDVTTHGVVPESPLLHTNSTFFRNRGVWANGTAWPGTWRMIDYNYSNPDFRRYWPELFIQTVERFGVDGFRLDCGMTGGTTALSLAKSLWDQVSNR